MFGQNFLRSRCCEDNRIFADNECICLIVQTISIRLSNSDTLKKSDPSRSLASQFERR